MNIKKIKTEFPIVSNAIEFKIRILIDGDYFY